LPRSSSVQFIPRRRASSWWFTSRSRWIEARTGWTVRKFVRTARRYRTIQIQAGRQTITAAGPLPDDLRQALDAINPDS
jgi:hypothetical protein